LENTTLVPVGNAPTLRRITLPIVDSKSPNKT
jgi:hypothetical protein